MNPELVPEETLDQLERRIRAGLGPDEALIDVIKDGVNTEVWVDGPGLALVRASAKAAVTLLQQMTQAPPTSPQQAFEHVLALTSELSILRRVAATILAGKLAERDLDAREREASELTELRLP